MYKFAVKRLLQTAFVVLAVTFVVLLALNSSGDPAALLLPFEATDEMVEQLRRDMGLDRPLLLQYVSFMEFAATGGLESYRFNRPAFPMVLEYFGRSLGLVAVSLVLTVVLAIPLGVWAAHKRGTVVDVSVLGFSYVGQAVPLFWLAILLILVFAVWLRWLPVSGLGSVSHWVLPTVTLVAYNLAIIVRLTRSSMLEVIREDYVRSARAKGLSSTRVLVVHALRNALVGVVSFLGVRTSEMLGGVLIVEVVFSWPGLGWLFYTGIAQRDYPLVLSGAIVTAAVVGATNLAVDLVNARLDPRLQES